MKEHVGSICGGQKDISCETEKYIARVEEDEDDEDERFFESQMSKGEGDEEHVLVTWDLR